MKNEDLDNLTKKEKATMLLASEYERERMENTGKIMVSVIAVVNIVLSVFNLTFSAFGIFVLALYIAVSLALIWGQNWARILFIIESIIVVIISLFALFVVGFNFMLFVMLVYSIAATVMLLSKSVSEYMYKAKNG